MRLKLRGSKVSTDWFSQNKEICGGVYQRGNSFQFNEKMFKLVDALFEEWVLHSEKGSVFEVAIFDRIFQMILQSLKSLLILAQISSNPLSDLAMQFSASFRGHSIVDMVPYHFVRKTPASER